MKLDADPTVIYPVTKGKPLGRRILKSELNAENPYNTYTRPGLPQGPIANPGKASIAAVLHPAQTKALYFVADGTGGHVFAEHSCRAKCQRRQMVRDSPPARSDVSNRGIGRARMFMGGLLLFAAVIAWFVGLMMSPHGAIVAGGTEHVRMTVVIFVRKSAIGTLILCALAAGCCFRCAGRNGQRGTGCYRIIGVMVASSLYKLIWLRSVVH